MALLNYGKSLSQLSDWLQATLENNKDKYLLLVFSNDGHIITHGKDYLPDFTSTTTGRGLVSKPSVTENLDKLFLRGDNTWNAIQYEDLSAVITTTLTKSDDKIPTSNAVITYLETTYKEAINAAQAMVFKGIIEVSDTEIIGFPTECKIGDTYKIKNDKNSTTKIAGQLVRSGDIIICIAEPETSGVDLNSNVYFTVIENNIEGVTHVLLNGSTNDILDLYSYTNHSTLNLITTDGGVPVEGYVLLANGTGNNAKWVSPTTLSISVPEATDLTYGGIKLGYSTSEKNYAVQLDSNGKAYVNVPWTNTNSNYENKPAFSNIKVGETTLSATDIQDTLTIIGSNILIGATEDTDNNKILNIGISRETIINLIGFEPGHATATTESFTIALGKNDTVTDEDITNPYLKLILLTTTSETTTNTVKKGIGFVGNNGISTASGSGIISISGIAFTGATSNTKGTIGMVPAPEAGLQSLFLRADSTWAAVPTENTWRDIQVSGNSIGNKILNFAPVGSIGIVANTLDLIGSTEEVFDIGFDLYWYNIDDNKYETV